MSTEETPMVGEEMARCGEWLPGVGDSWSRITPAAEEDWKWG